MYTRVHQGFIPMSHSTEGITRRNIIKHNKASLVLPGNKSCRRSTAWHTDWLISAGTRTRSLWIRSPARYSIAPQRLRRDGGGWCGLDSLHPLISSLASSPQHQDQSEPTCLQYTRAPLEGAVVAQLNWDASGQLAHNRMLGRRIRK